ncbi:chemotaxis protein CheB [Polynucleobacter sp. AP-Reno-20A-A9]|uniref:chemotaxis protein CheB n=1 Tax=Polynucleobacter sp. AP-Reno-20A-A9 TaxID=2576925 RepID=UPI001C0B976B|nr:chemotaxis protein CheB [Polynucleobacter sp. AP-Reno-20A-A9]MBU3629093.1 response regulator [Polynucleobacter sp. AP-Reno-20A-A9]
MPNNGEAAPIRVLLVEDSPLQLHIIKSVLDADAHIEVVGTAMNGAEALNLLPVVRPDVICTDYHMPVMDGLEFIQKAVKIYPCPILVLSISVQPDQVDNIFKLLSAGAIDVMPKPRATGGIIGKEDGLKLVERIRIINGVKYIPRKKGQPIPPPSAKCLIPRLVLPKIIVMGASTGGPQAFEVILSGLKNHFSIPIVCIQHISHGFLAGMLTWLRGICPLIIETATEGGFPMPGHIYFPPDGMHLTFSNNGAFVICPPNLDDMYCPSIDKLFHSTAEVYGNSAVAVILSGMGRDGANGMKTIFDAGGDTVAQDEDSSIIFGMPAVAINLGVICNVLSANEIAPYLNDLPGNISP